MDFIPNWQRMKLESKDTAWEHVLRCLVEDKDKITSKSLNNEATFILGNQTFIIKGKEKKKKK